MTISQSDLEDKANAPKRASTDEGLVEERPAGEIIALDRYAQSKGATSAPNSKPPHGLYISQIKPGGTIASS